MKKSFKEFKIRGVKALKDWTLIANIIKTKAHLTPQGLSRIKKIKGGGLWTEVELNTSPIS